MEEKQNKIDVESILEEIRKEIKENGYTNDLLSFDDCQVNMEGMSLNYFNKRAFYEDVVSINHLWNVAPDHAIPFSGNIFKKFMTFVKKIIRRLIKFHVDPIVSDQRRFNADVVKAMNMVNAYIDEKEIEIERLTLKQEQLSKRIRQLEENK
jgi:hypothetical protein